GYERLMRQHEEKSRARVEIKGPAEALDALFDPFVEDVLDRETDDRLKWSTPTTTAGVVAVFSRDNQVVLVLDRTCFYVESGGQVGDRGTISTETGRLEVEGVARCRNAIIHVGHLIEGGIHVGQTVLLQVDPEREFTRKNHTATHLLHWALQKVLGDHVEQRGSKVKPDEFTFDFSHTGPLTEEEKREVERLVNEKIYQDLPVTWRELPTKEAQKLPGVRAFFGDKYGDVVRVVEIHQDPLTPGPSPPGGRGEKDDVFSREFCGGTHLDHTGQAGFFKIVGEEAVSKGVRRLTCVTGREAVATVQRQDAILADLAGRFRCKPEELSGRIDSLQEEVK